MIVLYFGDMQKENFSFPLLRDMLLEVFSRQGSVR